jgi:diaminopimelate decarboxylase
LNVYPLVRNFNFYFFCTEEVEFILKHFENIDRKDILFTPNFVPIEEYQKAIELKVNLTVDNLYPLEKHPEVFKNQKLYLRIDTTQEGKGHHIKVQTSGCNSKFGIPYDDVKEVYEIVKNLNIEIIGLRIFFELKPQMHMLEVVSWMTLKFGLKILTDFLFWWKNISQKLNSLMSVVVSVFLINQMIFN